MPLAGHARSALRWYRQASQLAVAITGLILLLWSGALGQQAGEPSPPAAAGTAAPAGPDSGTLLPPGSAAAALPDSAAASVTEGVAEATGAFRGLLNQLLGLLPKLGFALAILLAAWLLTRLLRPLFRRVLRSWSRATALWAVFALGIWLLAVAGAASVLVGDVRALLGSVGLLGLAASWALQAPIESFAGWLLNSFRDYYRQGDRIAVADTIGDVYRIDVLTTTLWEVGGPDKAVRAAQPTGALVTVPNSEILRGTIINFTRDLPYVWDELTVQLANESDLEYALRVLGDTAREVFGTAMTTPTERYRMLLARQGLDGEVATEPQLYAEPADAWTNIIIRYLVPARERRAWSSRLFVRVAQEVASPEHGQRIISAYPVQRIHLYREEER